MKQLGCMCAFVLLLALEACGAPQTHELPEAPSATALGRVEVLARTGTGRDWGRANREEKRAFTLAAIVGLGFDRHPAREQLARDLADCIDTTAVADPEQPLAQLAADCVNRELRDDAIELMSRSR